MQAMTVCKDCGKEFVYTYHGQKRTICDECRRWNDTKRKRAYRAEKSGGQTVEPVRQKKSVTNERIIATANRASKLGLTYGVYMGKE